MNVAKFFILWGPTLVFILIVLKGIVLGCSRGFRKSLILFIQMLVVGFFCLILYLCLVNNSNIDSNMVKFINNFLKMFGVSLQGLMEVNSSCETLHEILTQYLLKDTDLSINPLNYYLVLENMAYINTIVNMAYHIILALACLILYHILIFLMYLIYLIFYPVRRKIKEENDRYHNGESNHPYQKKRVLGGLIGGIRSLISAVIGFSFLGSLIFVVTGGTNLPGRDEFQEDTVIEFSDPNFNILYDYYSYVCEMGHTGIFQVLNGIKDTNQTPFYFYFADLVLQGKIEDENLGIHNEKFYLRDELGEYVHFVNSSFALLLKYSDLDSLDMLIKNQNQTQLVNVLVLAMQNEGFNKEFADLIDSFEGKSFMSNLCLSTLTSLVNHIDLVAKDNEELIGIVNQLFKGEDAIKVSDLATESDIKNLFKGLISVVASIDFEQEAFLESEYQQSIISTKQTILIAQKLIPTIQNLSLFKDRKDIGNKILKGLYTYCSTSLLAEQMSFNVPDDLDWIEEFNILLDACVPLLSIYYEIYDKDEKQLIRNFAYIFEGENQNQIEEDFDALSEQLIRSKILDIVFKSSLVGKYIDQIVLSITQNEEAGIPKNIDYSGKNGECSIFLQTLKVILKNGGGQIILAMTETKDTINSEMIVQMLDLLVKPLEENSTMTILDKLLESKLLYYMISTYFTYAEFGTFKLYIPETSVDYIVEGAQENLKTYAIIKHEEIKVITNLLLNCKELIINLIDNPEQFEYTTLLTNDYIRSTVNESLLLQGTLANVFIGISNDADVIILPETYDSPEQWLSSPTTRGEMVILIDAIFNLSNENEVIINDLLNGQIKPSVLLDLNNDTINKLCSSKVLRYTISDMITALGTNGFEIVVARESIEELNAKTTREKTINVIRATDLYEIFVDIKSIVSFDSQDQVKVNYNAVFENKTEISHSKTITATLIQLLMTNSDSGFVVIPMIYQEDFEKIKTDYDLTDNVWFGNASTVEDDELYLLLVAIETLIEKDENGKIPEEFDFGTLDTSLILKRNEMNILCSSAILDASISQQIVNIFNVTEDLFIYDFIEQTEMMAFFNSLFTMIGKDEIIATELDNNLLDVEFKKGDIDTILKSKIMLGTISETLLTQKDINIPSASASEVTYVGGLSSYMIDQQEVNNLFKSMFAMLNVEVMAVNAMNSQMNEFTLDSSDINMIFNSSILQATISNKVVDNQELIVPMLSTTYTQLLYLDAINMVEKEELEALFNALFILFEEDTIRVDELSTLLQNYTLNSSKIDALLNSVILQATLSKNFIQIEDLTIPNNVVEDILTTTAENVQWIILEELKAFFDGIFITTPSEISGTNFELGQLILPTTDAQAKIMTNSLIISATLTEKIRIEGSIVTIPDETLVKYYNSSNQSSNDSYIEQEELGNMLLALTIGMEKTDPLNLEFDNITIPAKRTAQQALVNSIIIRTTISKRVLEQESVSLRITSTSVFLDYHYNGNSIGILTDSEILNIIRGYELLNPNTSGTFDNLNLDIQEILVMENRQEVLEAIAYSDVYRSIISKTLGSSNGVQAYEMFLTSLQSVQITVDGENMVYTYVPSEYYSGYYTIQYPSTPTAVYTSFELQSGFDYICEKSDIIALNYVSG